MLLTMGLITGLIASALEIFFCRAIPPLHWLIKSNQAIDIAFSFLMAYLLNGGQMGPTMVLAGAVSNIITTIWWMGENHIGGWRTHIRESDTMVLLRDLWRVFVWTLRLITLPLRVMRAASLKYAAVRGALVK